VRETPAGALLRGLTAASATDAAVGHALVDDWLAPRRKVVVDLLVRGVGRGDVRPGLDYNSVIDVLFAPIYYRLIYQHQPLTDRLSAEIIAVCWPGIAAANQPAETTNKTE
jgi:hypothetical protein